MLFDAPLGAAHASSSELAFAVQRRPGQRVDRELTVLDRLLGTQLPQLNTKLAADEN